jgi:NADH dehydrogenase FAD-containing subunit
MSGEATVQRPSVVVVGGGFAGFFAAGALERLLPPQAADLTFISATDHLCYSPLLPEVAAGRLDPRRIAAAVGEPSVKYHPEITLVLTGP